MDDIFALFGSKKERDDFFQVLNSAHPNLKFTMETTTGALPFLDVTISIEEDGFNTGVYRKPTNTDVILNYHSVAPTKWKRSLIKCLLTRAYRLSSNINLFMSEVEKIKNILQRNSYPSAFIDRNIEEFLSSHSINENSFKNVGIGKEEQPEKSQESYITIPYIGKPSLKFQRKIQDHMLKRHDVAIRSAYTTTKVSSYFSLKSKCSPLFKSNIVYKFTCSEDRNTSYIGESRRQLVRRIEEHRSGSDKNSAIFNHLYQCVTCQNVKNVTDSFEIMESCKWYNILTIEAMMISTHCPILNTQLGPSRGKMTTFSVL